MLLPCASAIWLSRSGGAEGGSCHDTTALPGVLAQKATRATLNVPVAGGLLTLPEAKLIEPAGSVLPAPWHCSLPWHTSFCSTTSKCVVSVCRVPVAVHEGPTGSTTCNKDWVKVR